MKQKLKFGIMGFIAGILNGIFGSGGGLLIVPMLQSQKLEPRKAHATSISIILPLSVISTAMYLINGIKTDWVQLTTITALGFAGAAVGAILLMKIKNKLLKQIFGFIMIISAIRIFLK